MDPELIAEKLESLRRCVQRVADKRPTNAQILAEDIDLQDILTLNLSRAVQLCVDIAAHLIADLELPAPGTMGETFDRLEEAKIIQPGLAHSLKKAVGFRNVAVHNYETINWTIVHTIATNNLVDFTEFAKAVSDRLPRSRS